MTLKFASIAGTALVLVSACGYRGDLERPEPLFGVPEEVAQTETTTVDETLVVENDLPDGSYRDPITGVIVWQNNENGGEIPLSSPSDSIGEDSLPPPVG